MLIEARVRLAKLATLRLHTERLMDGGVGDRDLQTACECFDKEARRVEERVERLSRLEVVR